MLSNQSLKDVVIMMADDDEDDVFLTRRALKDTKLGNAFFSVGNGKELLDFLRNEPPFEDPKKFPRPGIILLDLNMPILNGRETLVELKKDPHLRTIPVIVMTTSQNEVDVYKSYDLGANSYIVKPVTLPKMIQCIDLLDQYWMKMVKLPGKSYVG